MVTPIAPSFAGTPNNGPEFVSMGQCNSYLNRWSIASARGENWDVFAQFDAAHCEPSGWGTFIAVFPSD